MAWQQIDLSHKSAEQTVENKGQSAILWFKLNIALHIA